MGSLLERDHELAAVAELLGQGGGVVLIEGGLGIGKTSLVDAACGHAAGLGYEVLRARGRELERDFAFGIVRQLFLAPRLGALAVAVIVALRPVKSRFRGSLDALRAEASAPLRPEPLTEAAVDTLVRRELGAAKLGIDGRSQLAEALGQREKTRVATL